MKTVALALLFSTSLFITSFAADAPSDSSVMSAIANPQRTQKDRDNDAWRRPTVVLNFLALKPGMHAMDYFAAGGYYSELMSYLVGPKGEVIAYNNEAYFGYASKAIPLRYGENRLPNVKQVTESVDQLTIAKNSIDAVLINNAFHDLYWRPKRQSEWPTTDPIAALKNLFAVVKPGGIVVVADHVDRAGQDPYVRVDAVHRIDPAVIKRDFAKVGFKFAGEDKSFANPDDDYTKSAEDASVLHQTDRVIYKFMKP